MHIIDICLAALLGFGAYRGYKAGLAVILINTLAMVMAVVVALRFLDKATLFLAAQIEANKLFLPILAFAGLFCIVFLGLRWFAVVTSKTIRYTMLGAVDQAAGAVFGVFRMAFILSSAAFGLQMMGVSIRPAGTENMILLPAILQLGPAGFSLLAPLLPFLKKLLQV